MCNFSVHIAEGTVSPCILDHLTAMLPHSDAAQYAKILCKNNVTYDQLFRCVRASAFTNVREIVECVRCGYLCSPEKKEKE